MPDQSVVDPRAEYERRLDMRRRASARQEQIDVRIAALRLIVLVAAGLIAWLAFHSALLSAWWLMLPALAFLALLTAHERVRRKRRRLERAVAFYSRGIARLDHQWAGSGVSGERFVDQAHAYVEDLDLFGKGSLYELLCAARTRAGEETLASWLASPASLEQVRARQEAIAELSKRLDLREDLAAFGEDVLTGVDPKALAAWSAAPPGLGPPWIRILAALLAWSATLTLILWLGWDRARLAFLLSILAEAVLAYCLRRRVGAVLAAVEHPAQDLALLSQLLRRLEQERFATPWLVQLRKTLDVEGLPPSKQITRLNRILALQQQLFAPLAALLLWNIQMAFAIESWRKKSGHAVARWLEVIGGMEALCSLGRHAYEHPEDPFPELDPSGPCFDAEGLGHPLLSESICVRNDVRLDHDLRVLVVSGSNMSGKSTLLRTIGTNAVLALAGAPVRARRLRLSPLAVGASIQRRDSLQAGTSRFYAEILRLRQLVDITQGPLPLLFLLDELLHGTNSHDRSIGAEALVRDLVRRGAIGLLTTHDLALAGIAEVLAPHADNVHFEDFIAEGKLAFDYRLRPGVVRRSNAIELMRSIGLQI